MFHQLQRKNALAIMAEEDKQGGLGNSKESRTAVVLLPSPLFVRERKLSFTSLIKFPTYEGKN